MPVLELRARVRSRHGKGRLKGPLSYCLDVGSTTVVAVGFYLYGAALAALLPSPVVGFYGAAPLPSPVVHEHPVVVLGFCCCGLHGPLVGLPRSALGCLRGLQAPIPVLLVFHTV